jgi:long-chain acyl-CoA synthetase
MSESNPYASCFWVKNYPAGVPAEIDVNHYSSLVAMYENSFKQFASRDAYRQMGARLSYAQLAQGSKQFAAYLQHTLQLAPGTRIAMMLPNVLQYPLCMIGAHRAGLTVVNINPLYKARELAYVLKDSQATCIVILENFMHTLSKIIAQTQLKHVLVTQLGDSFPWIKRTLVNSVVKYVKKLVPSWHLPQAIRLNHALKLGAKAPFKPVTVTHEDIAFLQYTGGTIGISKGAILTHKNMVANLLQALAWIKPFIKQDLKGGIITALPLYHIFSLTANCLVFQSVGITNILITNPRDITDFIKTLRRESFSIMTGVNTLFNALLHHPQFAKLDFTDFRFTLGGGMAVQKSVAEKWQAVTGVPLIEAYGLTETAPAVAINPLLKDATYNGSVGMPLPSTQIKICDEQQNIVPLGERGELCVQGPQVMQGYWQSPANTQAVLSKDGWLKTGDIATLDRLGYLRIVDRKKDMILVSGFNVYPNEVEEVISGLPGVKEVAVIGVVSDSTGEAVKAFIVKEDPTLTEQQVLALCHENLTAYKIPKFIEFSAELPKTNVGKVLRRALKSPAE